MSIRAKLMDRYDLPPDTLFLGSDNGDFDTAIVGVIDREGISVILYDERLVIECLMGQGMTDEDAWDWWGANIECAYLGPHTPMYCRTLEPNA